MKFAPKIKAKNQINLNNSVRSELPFSQKELLNIFKIVDAALADEKIEHEIYDWLNLMHDDVSLEELESLHRKINLFLQGKNNERS